MKHHQHSWVGLFALVPLALAGCGGGSNGGGFGSNSGGNGNNGGGTALTGNAAVKAALVSSNQAFQGGVAYPFAQVQATLPNGSTLKSAFRAALAAAAKKRAAGHALSSHAIEGPDFLGLYDTTTISGNTSTSTLYTDAAGTQAAGTLTITQTSPTTTGFNPGTYSSYPVAFTIAANVTSGPLPMAGSGTIALNDSAGAGEIKGSLTLPATHVSASADLTLDDSGNVGGTASVTENGQTITLSQVTGSLAGTLTGNVTVAPQGYTGTGTLSIVNDTFSVTLNTPSGTATGATDGSGNLVITYPGGGTETITNPLSASPLSPVNTGGGGGTGGGGTATLFPFADWQPAVSNSIPFNVLINDSNQVLEQNANTQLIYFPNVNALATQSTIAGPSGDPIALVGFNNAGEFVANSQAITAIYVWSGPTAAPTKLALPATDGIGSAAPTGTASALSSSGEIVGSANLTSTGTFEGPHSGGPVPLGTNTFFGAFTWASAQAQPAVLCPLSNSAATVQGYTFAVVGSNVLISGPSGADTYALSYAGAENADPGTTSTPVADGQASMPLVFEQQPSLITAPFPAGIYSLTFTATRAGQQVASFPVTLTVGDSGAQPTGVNKNGLIVGFSNPGVYGQNTPVYWTSGSPVAQALPAPGGADATAFTTLGVSDNGTIYGNTNTGHVYVWSSVTAQPTLLPTLVGRGNAVAISVSANGVIAGTIGGQSAVIWKNGQVIDLGPYGTPQTTVGDTTYNTALSSVTSINSSGIAVGFADITPFALRLQ